jgi:hypothetical protein
MEKTYSPQKKMETYLLCTVHIRQSKMGHVQFFLRLDLKTVSKYNEMCN